MLYMQNKSALAALQAIDIVVYQTSHKELSPDAIEELRSACSSLVKSVQGDAFFAEKAMRLVELIQADFLGSVPNPGRHRVEILKCGITLSIFIHRQAGALPVIDEKTSG
jgi:hypothetical protein